MNYDFELSIDEMLEYIENTQIICDAENINNYEIIEDYKSFALYE